MFQLGFRYVRDAPGRGAQLVRVYKRAKSLAQSVLRCGENVAGFNFLSVLMIIMGWFIQFFQNFPVKVFAHVNKPVQRGGQCVAMTGEPKHSGVVCRGGHTRGTRSVVSQIGWFLIAGGGVYAQRHLLIEESPKHILGYSSYL